MVAMASASLCTLTGKKNLLPKDIPLAFFWVNLQKKSNFSPPLPLQPILLQIQIFFNALRICVAWGGVGEGVELR